MEILTTKILLFPLPNITNELGDLITIPNDYPEPQFLGRNTPTQFSVPSLAKYYLRRNT